MRAKQKERPKTRGTDQVCDLLQQKLARHSVYTIRQLFINWPLSDIFNWQLTVIAVERRLFQILYIIQYYHPGEKGLPCALNDYDFYRL